MGCKLGQEKKKKKELNEKGERRTISAFTSYVGKSRRCIRKQIYIYISPCSDTVFYCIVNCRCAKVAKRWIRKKKRANRRGNTFPHEEAVPSQYISCCCLFVFMPFFCLFVSSSPLCHFSFRKREKKKEVSLPASSINFLERKFSLLEYYYYYCENEGY